jgi:hypothetical protein
LSQKDRPAINFIRSPILSQKPIHSSQKDRPANNMIRSSFRSQKQIHSSQKSIHSLLSFLPDNKYTFLARASLNNSESGMPLRGRLITVEKTIGSTRDRIHVENFVLAFGDPPDGAADRAACVEWHNDDFVAETHFLR